MSSDGPTPASALSFGVIIPRPLLRQIRPDMPLGVQLAAFLDVVEVVVEAQAEHDDYIEAIGWIMEAIQLTRAAGDTPPTSVLRTLHLLVLACAASESLLARARAAAGFEGSE